MELPEERILILLQTLFKRLCSGKFNTAVAIGTEEVPCNKTLTFTKTMTTCTAMEATLVAETTAEITLLDFKKQQGLIFSTKKVLTTLQTYFSTTLLLRLDATRHNLMKLDELTRPSIGT